MVRHEGALYCLQALRSAASTAVTASALDSAEELGVRTHHLRSLSFGYMGLERDLAEARLRVGQLEAVRPTGWHVTLSGSTSSLIVYTPSWDCRVEGAAERGDGAA
jgi:hypothetical protein